MKRAQIAKFAGKAARERADTFGTLVQFRGAGLHWCLSSPMPDAEEGGPGFRERVELVARVPASVVPPPRRGEQVVIVATGKTLAVLSALPADGNNPLAAEHLVNLVTP